MDSDTTVVPELVHPDRDEITITAVLHALADPIRLEMVRQLDRAERDGVRLACRAFDVPVTKSTLTHHLRTLREAGVTRTRREGTNKYSSLRREDLNTLFPGLLPAVLSAPTNPQLTTLRARV